MPIRITGAAETSVAETAPSDDPAVWQNSARSGTANRAFFGRYIPRRTFTSVTAVFFTTVAASIDDPCEISVWDAPATTRLATTGELTGRLNSTGRKTAALAYTFRKGTVYYVAFGFGTIGGTVPSVAARTVQDTAVLNLLGASPPDQLGGYVDTFYPAPATRAAGALSLLGVCPLIGFLES